MARTDNIHQLPADLPVPIDDGACNHLMVLIKRLTLVLREGTIEKVFYPVFPPDKNAGQVVARLTQAR